MNIVNRLLLCLLLSLSAPVAATCWKLAEHTYGIEARLLYAIAMTESGLNPNARNSNRNGTYDIGLMQINSIHFQRLKKIGVSQEMLHENACVSLMVGASILSEMIGRYGYTWEAVGAYNAGTSKNRQALRMKYAGKVRQNYQRSHAEFR